ncbi:MAG: hypothetical protein K5922_02545 [Clostridiales bacterium]|nr:hypothetical protein [Clostridiales bacterium]
MNGKRMLAGLLAGLLAMCLIAGSSAEWKEETKNGKVVRRTWVNESGAPAVSPQGYAMAKLSYTGTSVTEKYYDLAGNPAMTVGGYYGQILTYGNRHRLEEIIYLNAKGNKMECEAGYARVKIIYTSAGGVTSAGYYDLGNSLVMVPSLGYAQVKNDYRGTTLTKTTYLDENKKPVDTPLGYAVRIQSVNKSNKVTGVRFEHADGSPAACTEGWASMKREMDSKHREVSLKYYDLSGKLVDRGLSYAYEVKKWESDQTCVISRYDTADRQVYMGPGYVSLRREMNRDGQVIRETCLDQNGTAVKDEEGVTSRKYTYDDHGRLTKVTYEGARGDAAENNAGCAGYQETLDADGFVRSRVFLSKGGKPVNTAAGYSEIRYQYDSLGQISKTEYFDVNGTLVKSE